MVECRDVLDDLGAWRARVLDASRQAAITAHLAACASCAAEERADAALEGALAAERDRAPVGPGAAARTLARLDALGRPPAATPTPWGLVALVLFVLGLAATADLRAPAPARPPRDPLPLRAAPLPPEVTPRDTPPDSRPLPSPFAAQEA